MFERPQSGEQALLIHCEFRCLSEQPDLREFRELALAAGAEPLATITGARDEPDPKYFVGRGKAVEISEAVGMHGAQVVLFNHDLSPAQERNLERLFKCRVLSRTGLILDIFAQRARTFEGKLQVELAQLQHLSTRLVRGWTHLERQKGGIGLRGPGETQLESDRRLIRHRIKSITARLAKVRKQRQQSRRARERVAVPTVALVGYTNAGKSTLFNALTGSTVKVANQLFATLDPTLRTLLLKGAGKIVLADTVGFVRNLPHKLVEAFRATLEETRSAQLLLHVVDGHDERANQTVTHVNDVLEEIGAQEVPQVVVYNKADLLDPSSSHFPGQVSAHGETVKSVWVSALTREGLEELKLALKRTLFKGVVTGWVKLEPAMGALRNQLYDLGAVLFEKVDDQGCWDLEVQISRDQWDKICRKHQCLELLMGDH